MSVDEQIRTMRSQAVATINASSSGMQALQGAMILRAGGRLDHPAYRTPQALAIGLPDWLRQDIDAPERQRTMEAAHRYSDMSLIDFARETLRLSGRQPGANRSATLAAAFSGSSFSNIFTTSVNARVLASYVEATDTTDGWTTPTEVDNFKLQERPRVGVGSGLTKLPRGGSADHASYADSVESYRIARYAKQFQVDEQDILDDSVGALRDTPQRIGQAAARLRPDLVYSILLANPTLNATSRALFNTTDANLGSSSALAAATLRAGVAAFLLVTENNVPLNLTATHLIVPPTLKHQAIELVVSSQIIITGSTPTERGNYNAIQEERLTVVSDARLENGTTDPSSGTSYSGSSSTWFLASTQAHTIEVAYLRGTGRAPVVRTWQLDRGQYGVAWDVCLDIGAKALDWRGLRKTTA